MNILFYIPYINQGMGGIRQYSAALLKILAKDTENVYFVYHEANDPEIVDVLSRNPHLKLVKTYPSDMKKWKIFSIKAKKTLFIYLRKFVGRSSENYALDRICEKHQIDIIHCPFQYLPQSKNVKSICTMHDVQELHFPEYFSPEDRAYRATNYLHDIKHADKVIVSYQHVKDDILKYFQKPADKVDVCLLEMDNLWIDRYNDSDVVSLNDLGIPDKFIFFPANTWQHKNHLQLLRAMVILNEEGFTNIKLVCSGHKTEYFDGHLKPFIEQHQLQNHVIFAGVLNENVLYSLYKKCVGVVVPTIYEAGSFPLMEAILLNVPVICSNVTSLPETIGDIDFIFDPKDALDMAHKIRRLWTDKAYRLKSLDNSLKMQSRLRNTGALDIIKGVYNDL